MRLAAGLASRIAADPAFVLLYLTHTKAGGRVLLRVAIGAAGTTDAHVDAAWWRIREEAAALTGVRTD